MSNPVWITPAGNLGIIVSQQTMTPVQLQATPEFPASTIFYRLYEGDLPPGVKLSSLGAITGNPIFVPQDTIYGFTIQAYDNLGNTSLRDFNFLVKNPNPVWKTPNTYVLNGATLTDTSLYNNITWSLGTFPSKQPVTDIILQATPVIPANKIVYKIISGNLPTGVVLTNDKENNIAIITGIPTEDIQSQTYTFVVRATDNLNKISDRTFSMTVIGSLLPFFVTESGALQATIDSVWYQYQVEFENPSGDLYPASISIASGELPPGLEVNEVGLIRGYAAAPVVEQNYNQVTSVATSSNYNSQTFTCLSTVDFKVGRPLRFSGAVFGGVEAFNPLDPSGTTYYVKEIVSNSEFKISQTIDGAVFIPSSAVGLMNITLPEGTQNTPISRIYNFTLRINSQLGNQLRSFSIQVTNKDINSVPGTRTPIIYNTRPFTYNIDNDVTNFGFYVLPPFGEITGQTYTNNTFAPIGTFYSGDFFTFKILGYDFDNATIEYLYDIPAGYNLVADIDTGWIRGTLNIANNTISTYNFTARVRKKDNPSIISEPTNFSFIVTNNLNDEVTWITDELLGNIFNGTISTFSVQAINQVALEYELVNGALPNNLVLQSNGNIVGSVAFETTTDYAPKDTVIPYTFSVRAYDPNNKELIQSVRTFTLNVVQKFIQPVDTLYIQCTPSLVDRAVIYSLLNDNTLIPESYLYRPDDPNFGKANNITYAHAYGIYASSLQEYIEAVQINHYWRNITLGPLKTAVARDENNNIIYEVVYSEIIDNLVNPQGISVSKKIVWDFFIDLNLGPWYTSITDVYTSYIYPVQLDLLTQNKIFYISTQDNLALSTNQGSPTFYTSLTPGYARELFPNSLSNMRQQVEDVLKVDASADLLPKWMSSQQATGSTLGFTPAWVIAYCKPEITTLPNGTTVSLAERVKYNIENNWKTPAGTQNTLNTIDFQIDRFTVNKSLTYDYDKNFDPAAWTHLPSGVPQPDPIDSKNFNVLFPRKTILPTKTQKFM